ncbi:hypothetical protein PUNSTDRAFT_139575 [Punctularia strigosozonata HHB-11173 SS5]|uniref:C2H2-type domain-containing protein n=1 Tax=Punctularia strigosozonata (strain HHB-11173) TaxID=741275 RepID=R7S0N1_PUNST|nr:uncharacterized protein PUNSTDRAFT_139575 [Punctularia strigosozonata HHB-11173 SS5]EIN03409.1 hypothetical protein PUNSTDRAFT_139575 [Punctularia strigosozonata HHB-11173 SS5]
MDSAIPSVSQAAPPPPIPGRATSPSSPTLPSTPVAATISTTQPSTPAEEGTAIESNPPGPLYHCDRPHCPNPQDKDRLYKAHAEKYHQKKTHVRVDGVKHRATRIGNTEDFQCWTCGRSCKGARAARTHMLTHTASSTVASGSTDEQLQPQTAVDAAVRMIGSLARRITGRSSLSTGGPSQDEKSRPLPHSAPQAETLQRASSIGSKRQRSNEETARPSPRQHKKARCESRLTDEVEEDADDERYDEDEDDDEDQDEGEDEYEGEDDEDDSNFGDEDEDEDEDEGEAESFNDDVEVKVGTLSSSPLFDYYDIDGVDYPAAMVHVGEEEPESMDDEDHKIWLVLGDEDDVDVEVGSESEWEDAPRDVWQGIGQHERDAEVARIQATVHFGRDELPQDGEDKTAKLLRKAQCTVNLTYRVLICHKCGYALDPTALNGHFDSKHNGKLSKKNKISLRKLCERRGLVGPDEAKRIRPRNRRIIHGLTLHPSIVFCAFCHTGAISEAGLARRHTQCRAHEDLKSVPLAQRCYRSMAQTFFSKTIQKRFFPVLYRSLPEPVNDAAAATAWKLIDADLERVSLEQVPISEPEDDRQLSVFEMREGWRVYMKGRTGVQLQEIFDGSKDPEALGLLRLYMERYVDVALDALQREPYTVWEMLANNGIRDNNPGHVGRIKTWKIYVREVFPVLLFVIRAAIGLMPNHFSLELTDDQRRHALELAQLLDAAHKAGKGPVSNKKRLAAHRLLKPFMDRFGHDKPIVSVLHHLLWSLLSHENEGSEPNKFFTPLYNYFVLSCYDEHASLKSAEAIRHIISRTVYICRLGIYVQGVLHSQEAKISFFKAYKFIEPYLKIHANTALANIFSANRFVCSEARSSMGKPLLEFVDNKYDRWYHDGKIISMPMIGDVFKAQLVKIELLVVEKILMGRKMDDDVFDFTRVGIRDEPTNRSLHYSFVAHPGNHYDKYDRLLIKLWMDDQFTRDRFTKITRVDNRDKILYFEEELQDVFAAYNKLQDFLMIATWYCCGAPGRAAEWQALLGSNSQHGHMRSIYVFGDEIFIVTGYDKTTQQTGKHKINAKLLPDFLRPLLLFSKVVIRVRVS